jgi:hypothetical protein
MIQPQPRSQPVMPPVDLHLPDELAPGKFPWECRGTPLPRFHLANGNVEAPPFITLNRSRFIKGKPGAEDEVILEYSKVTLSIKGSMALKFHEFYCEQRATNVRIRGGEITSITIVITDPIVPIPPMP